MNNLTKTVFFILILFLLINCLSVSKDSPDKKFFVIESDRTQIVKKQFKFKSLKVSLLKSAPFFEVRELVYRNSDVSYETDFYNQLLITPSANITDKLNQWVVESGLADNTTNRIASIKSNLILDGIVNSLYGDLRDSKNPKSVVEIEFYIIDNTNNPKVIFKKSYLSSKNIPKKDPESIVKGWNQGLTEIFINFEKDVRLLEYKEE